MSTIGIGVLAGDVVRQWYVRLSTLKHISLASKLGPAGTGKTESVKALGHQLGRFVLVFNCDETFDFQVSCSI